MSFERTRQEDASCPRRSSMQSRAAASAISWDSPVLGGKGAHSPYPTLPSRNVTVMSTLRASEMLPVAMVNGSNRGIVKGSTAIDSIVVSDMLYQPFHLCSKLD